MAIHSQDTFSKAKAEPSATETLKEFLIKSKGVSDPVDIIFNYGDNFAISGTCSSSVKKVSRGFRMSSIVSRLLQILQS